MSEGCRAWLLSAILAMLGAALVARRWLDIGAIEGRSMAPTLLPGDWLLLERVTYRLRTPRPGDVAVAIDPRDAGRELIKRVTEVDAFGVTLRGDNRTASTDARAFGVIPISALRWRAILRYWPLGRIGRIPGRSERLVSEGTGE